MRRIRWQWWFGLVLVALCGLARAYDLSLQRTNAIATQTAFPGQQETRAAQIRENGIATLRSAPLRTVFPTVIGR